MKFEQQKVKIFLDAHVRVNEWSTPFQSCRKAPRAKS